MEAKGDDKAMKALLSKFPELKVTAHGRVRCSLSGHEMPYKLPALKSYVGGKRFASLKMHSDFDYAGLQPLIVPSQKRKYQLFCALTNRYLNKRPDEVRGHLSGRRYKKALEEYNAGERLLFKERLRKHQQQNQSEDTGGMEEEEEVSPGDGEEVTDHAPVWARDEESSPPGDKHKVKMEWTPAEEKSERVTVDPSLLPDGEVEGREVGEEEAGEEEVEAVAGRAARKRGRHFRVIKKLKMLKKRARLAVAEECV